MTILHDLTDGQLHLVDLIYKKNIMETLNWLALSDDKNKLNNNGK